MAMTLRDLLTGNMPGNALANIPLGDPKDPQANKFTYNIFGSLGPGAGVDTGMSRLFGGFSGQEPGQAPSPVQAGGGKPPPDLNQFWGTRNNMPMNFAAGMGGKSSGGVPDYRSIMAGPENNWTGKTPTNMPNYGNSLTRGVGGGLRGKILNPNRGGGMPWGSLFS